jgi:hypothetical protein
LRKLINSVLDSDNDDSDFSDNKSESEESSSDSVSESSADSSEESDDNDDDAPGPNQRQTNAVGTVQHNRKDMPRDISKSKLKRGEHEIWSANNILCVKWRDNKDVYFLSSKHKSADITATGKLRRKRGQEPREEVKKPKCALKYQKGMGGVDLQDQETTLFPIMRCTVKGYRKIFFYLLDM